MPDETDTSTEETSTESAQTTEQAAEDTTDWKAEARKWEQRARENGTKAKEFEKKSRSAMTDAERAVAEAEERGRTSAAEQFGTRLVRTEFDAAAGRRNPDFDIKATLDDLNLSKFVGDDGEPNVKAIKAAVERLVPAPVGGPPSVDGGARSNATTGTDMNQLIRKAAGRA